MFMTIFFAGLNIKNYPQSDMKLISGLAP